MILSRRRRRHCRLRPAILLLVFALLAPACKRDIPTQPGVTPPAPPPPAATDIYVDAVNGDDVTGDGSSSSPYRTIGAGLQNSSSGMTVIVRPGLYDAALGENFPLRLKEGVALLGSGPDQVTVDGGGADFVLEDAPQSRVESLTVLGGRLAGLILRNDSTLASCVVRGNYRGVVCESSATVDGNVITDNTETGLYLQGVSSASVLNNTIEGNGGDGVECVDSSAPTLRNNTIRENRKHGVTCTDSSTPTLEGNTVTRNVMPEVYVLYAARPTLTGNVIRGNERYGIDDARDPSQGQIDAVGNTWDDPQPSGTVFGPADGRPVYWIKHSGNSIKFSDGAIHEK